MPCTEQERLEEKFLEAVDRGDLQRVKDFVRRGGVNMVVQAKCSNSWRAIHLASFYGHLHIVRYLVEDCQVDASTKDNEGWTSLHFASRDGRLNMLPYLVHDCHVDATAENKEGLTPFDLACMHGRLDVIRFFIHDCQFYLFYNHQSSQVEE